MIVCIRRLPAIFATSVLFMSGQAAGANCTAPVLDGQLYSIASAAAGLVLDVPGGSVQAGTSLQQWGYAAGVHQQFLMRSVGNGYWTIQGRQSGMLLDVASASQAEGARVLQWPSNNGQNQQWLLKKSANGGYTVLARHSGKLLTASDKGSGAPIVQASDTASPAQRWYFNPAAGNCGNGPDGFAAQPGPDKLATTTGGGDAPAQLVNSCAALTGALKSTSPAVVQIAAGSTIDCRTVPRSQSACAVACPSYQDPGKTTFRIPVGSQTCKELGSTNETRYNRPRDEITIAVASNKTLLGLGPDARIIGASLNLGGARNIIIRNLAIENINPGLVEGGDGITMDRSSHIWIDHVRFKLISDGHIDIKNSANVTLSWNRFEGSNPAVCGSQHHYTSMVENSAVTLHHNFWNKSSGRNPKLDGAATRAHLYNNYWLDITYFAINGRDGAQAKIEGNFFANTARPHWNTGAALFDAPAGSNRYTGRSATDPYKNGGAKVFGDISMYRYVLDPVDLIPEKLSAGTGPR
ncbi:MAG TPA: RICIN domain-containing protein [Telluria sp.]|jgi:pectate lyase